MGLGFLPLQNLHPNIAPHDMRRNAHCKGAGGVEVVFQNTVFV